MIEYAETGSQIVEPLYPEAGYADLLDDPAAKSASPSVAAFLAKRDEAAVGSETTHGHNDRNCIDGGGGVIAKARSLGFAVRHCNRMTSQTQSQGFRRVVVNTVVSLPNSWRRHNELGLVERGSYQHVQNESLPKLMFCEVA